MSGLQGIILTLAAVQVLVLLLARGFSWLLLPTYVFVVLAGVVGALWFVDSWRDAYRRVKASRS